MPVRRVVGRAVFDGGATIAGVPPGGWRGRPSPPGPSRPRRPAGVPADNFSRFLAAALSARENVVKFS
jgi:hypothetical protein